MLEVEQGIIYETTNYFDYVDQLENLLTQQYPQLSLPYPLDFSSILEGKQRMNSNEKEFAKLLLEKNMIVYREPKIEMCDSVPDFFVYNPRTANGKLVEITLSKKETSDSRKRRQIRNLQLCGIPFVILFREHMENVRMYSWNKLF